MGRKKADFEELITELGAVQHGGEWRCKCPAHDDTNPSLYMSEKNDKILLKCFAGCSQEAVINALRARDLWPAPQVRNAPPPGVPRAYNGAEYTQRWQYRDLESQRVCGIVARYDFPDGSKQVIPFFRRWPAGGWRMGHSEQYERVLYNACYVAQAKTVFVVEGEKCADVITNTKRKIIGVTWPGGASSVSRANWSVLKDHPDVRIWPDNDAPGKGAASWIAKRLPRARQVDLSQFGDIPAGWDCADWVGGEDPLDLKLIEPDTAHEVPAQEKDPLPNLGGTYALNDHGNALRFVDMYAGRARYVPNLGWFLWEDNCWTKDDSNKVLLSAAEICAVIEKEASAAEDEDAAKRIVSFAQASGMLHRLRAMVEIAGAMPGVVTQPDDLDSDPLLFCCRNGVVDLRDRALHQNRPEYLITKQSPVVYDPEATAPTWEIFLRRIMGDNTELIEYLRRAIGYSLTSDTSEQIMFMLWGGGQNGKSVFVETLAKIFGTYHTATTSDLVLLDTQSGENAIARLKGARFVPASEVPENSRFNEARVKQLTGQDTVAARYLYKEYFEFRPHFKFWLRCNSRPQIQGADLGIWRRMHCVPFTQTISEAEKDKHLAQKLERELPGILNWAIQGCLEWQMIGLSPPNEVTDTVSEYREDMDRLGQWLEERCIQDEGLKAKGSTLYQSYKSWCEDSGERPLSQRVLMIKLKDRGFKRSIAGGNRYYCGLDVRQSLN